MNKQQQAAQSPQQRTQQRKQQLVQQGAAYRAAVSDSVKAIQHNLQPDMLARNTLRYAGKHVKPGFSAMLEQLMSKEGVAAAFMPLLMPVLKGGLPWLMSRRMRKPLIVLLAVALPAAAAYFARRKTKSGAGVASSAMQDNARSSDSIA